MSIDFIFNGEVTPPPLRTEVNFNFSEGTSASIKVGLFISAALLKGDIISASVSFGFSSSIGLVSGKVFSTEISIGFSSIAKVVQEKYTSQWEKESKVEGNWKGEDGWFPVYWESAAVVSTLYPFTLIETLLQERYFVPIIETKSIVVSAEVMDSLVLPSYFLPAIIIKAPIVRLDTVETLVSQNFFTPIIVSKDVRVLAATTETITSQSFFTPSIAYTPLAFVTHEEKITRAVFFVPTIKVE